MIQRTFIPGSRWLYLKLYTGNKTADELLVKVLHPLAAELSAQAAIDGYFFIRYTDPDFHVRFRLRIPDAEKYGTVLTALHRSLQPCVEDRRISKVLCDTYVRELERYGEETIEELEELFCADSACVLELLARLSEQPVLTRETFRSNLPLLLLDDTLAAFGYDLAHKLRLHAVMAESFRQEFGFTTHAYTKQLNDKYRAVRGEIEEIVATRAGSEPFADVLEARRNRFREIARRIETLTDAETAAVPVDNLLRSIQHMTMNRWFRSKNRLHELVIYDYLSRYYKSAQARTLADAHREDPENRRRSRENQNL